MIVREKKRCADISQLAVVVVLECALNYARLNVDLTDSSLLVILEAAILLVLPG